MDARIQNRWNDRCGRWCVSLFVFAAWANSAWAQPYNWDGSTLTFYGSSGDDIFSVHDSGDDLYLEWNLDGGGYQYDVIYDGALDVEYIVINCDAGSDTVYLHYLGYVGVPNFDTTEVYGEGGDDLIYGSLFENNYLVGGDGEDELSGGDEVDVFYTGTEANDIDGDVDTVNRNGGSNEIHCDGIDDIN